MSDMNIQKIRIYKDKQKTYWGGWAVSCGVSIDRLDGKHYHYALDEDRFNWLLKIINKLGRRKAWLRTGYYVPGGRDDGFIPKHMAAIERRCDLFFDFNRRIAQSVAQEIHHEKDTLPINYLVGIISRCCHGDRYFMDHHGAFDLYLSKFNKERFWCDRCNDLYIVPIGTTLCPCEIEPDYPLTTQQVWEALRSFDIQWTPDDLEEYAREQADTDGDYISDNDILEASH